MASEIDTVRMWAAAWSLSRDERKLARFAANWQPAAGRLQWTPSGRSASLTRPPEHDRGAATRLGRSAPKLRVGAG